MDGVRRDLLEVRDLKVYFRLPKLHPLAASQFVRAVDGVNFTVPRGSCLGLVGESGSGKSTVAMACMRLCPITAGEILLDGESLPAARGKSLRRLRAKFQIVFQDPYSSLNSRLRASAIVREPLDLMEIGDAASREERVRKMFARVGLRPEQRRLFPHQFSGGQRQRLAIARALVTNPDLVVLDEPVSALDVAIQAQILNLLRKLQAEFGLTCLFIGHDLGVIRHMCDRVAVMYMGKIVEQGECREIFSTPLHPYTRLLIDAVPSVKKRRLPPILPIGEPPNPIALPGGCRFHPRCPKVGDLCRRISPELDARAAGHQVACHYA